MSSFAIRVFNSVVKIAIISTVYISVISMPSPARAQQSGIKKTPTIPTQTPTRTFSWMTAIGVYVNADDMRNRPDTFNQPAQTPTVIHSKLGQSAVDEIVGPTVIDGVSANHPLGLWPPDSMGAIGPNQFFFTVNGRFRAYTKTTPRTIVFDKLDVDFWGTAADPMGVGDPHVRYDRATQRWFITEIDLRSTDNHLLVAVSATADLSTTSWLIYAIPLTGTTQPQDNNCKGDYDTLGIDQSALYIGMDMVSTFVGNCQLGGYLHSNVYLVLKTSLFTGTAQYGTFYNVTGGNAGANRPRYSPRGVDSYDSLPSGYVVWTNEAESPVAHIEVLQINNPTTNPTLAGPTLVAISPENQPIGHVYTRNSPSPQGFQDLNDRLFAAVIRNGHLWTAHNVAVDSLGGSNDVTRDRDAMRWYDFNVPALTLNQSGTVFDSSTAPNPTNYWMGTIMVSGQGHAVMGMNLASAGPTGLPPVAAVVGRLANDPPGIMGTLYAGYQFSTTDAYNDGNPVNRWGDYSYTSLDPCDDMTMWTVQEYIAGNTFTHDWGVAAEKIQAPGPAVLSAGPVATVVAGQSATIVNLAGTSPNGEGFYVTPNTITDPCRKQITVTATNGLVPTALSLSDPTHMALTLNTTAATGGIATLTVTNPDGQAVSTTITVVNPAKIDSIGIFRSGTFYLRLHNSTGFADITAAFNPASKPYPIVGDWTGAGYDTIGVLDQNNGLFSLRNSNTPGSPDEQFVLGNPNDTPLSGRWQSGAAHAGAGVFRPSNGLIYLKNSLTTGFADYTMVLGIPGDVGLAGDWNGDGIESPGVYRPSNITFYLTDQVCNCAVFGSYQFQFGNPGDTPVIGDWIGQGHDGVGLFRPSDGFTYLRNSLSTGFADITFVFGSAGDVPIAGHWQLTYPYPIAPPGNAFAPPILIPRTPAPSVVEQPPPNDGLGD